LMGQQMNEVLESGGGGKCTEVALLFICTFQTFPATSVIGLADGGLTSSLFP
jgi:hypothetical protein